MALHNPELLPLIPERLLRQHHVFERYDTRFRSAARLLQSLWRARRKFPEGHYTNAAGTRRRLGSRLAADAAREGANFLTPEIFGQARIDLAYREPGAPSATAASESTTRSISPQRYWRRLSPRIHFKKRLIPVRQDRYRLPCRFQSMLSISPPPSPTAPFNMRGIFMGATLP